MKRPMVAAAGMLVTGIAVADNLAGVDKFICATGEVVLCIEDDDCYSIPASEVDVPEFVIVDVRNKLLSTTKASARNRSTAVTTSNRAEGFIYLQGIDSGRAFSFVINEATGHVTASVARDGASVAVFGVCTDANVE